MKRPLRERRPALESLEGRALLSTTAGSRVAERASAVAGLTAARPQAAKDGDATVLKAGFVRSVEALDSTSVRIQFRNPIPRNQASRVHFEIDGLQVTASRMGRNGRFAVLTTTPQADQEYALRGWMGRSKALATKRIAATFSGKAAPRVDGVVPLGDRTIVVVFDREMGASAINPANYALTDANGNRTAIVGAQFLEGTTNRVGLTTVPLAYQTYAFNVLDVRDAGNQPVVFAGTRFTGNPDGAVVNAIATSPTTVTLAFNEPMADNALAPQNYAILAPDGTPLPVSSVRFLGQDNLLVELTTGGQSAVGYRVTTANITDRFAGGMTGNTIGFAGIAPVVVAPTLVSATSTGPNTVIVAFSRAMSDSALAPQNYAISDGLDPTLRALLGGGGTLAVTGVRFIGSERRVVELTTSDQANLTYTITPGAIADQAGTPLRSSGVATTFLGQRKAAEQPDTSGLPRVVGAASLGNTELIVAFSEPMADSAIRPEHFVVVPDDAGNPAAALTVTGAEFYNAERTVVRLRTLSQSQVAYRVVVVNANDLAGNALAPRFTSNGVVIDPTSATFPGTPPSGGQLADSDGDGLSDDAELRGWLVRVTRVDGQVAERRVTSDPYRTAPVFETDDAGNTIADANGVAIPSYRRTGPSRLVLDPAGLPVPVLEADGVTQAVETDPRLGLLILGPDGRPIPKFERTGPDALITTPGPGGSFPTLSAVPDRVVVSGDTDGDGLTDQVEATLGSDPRTADTDADQLGDYAEYNEIYSNLLDQDSDNDSLDDALEWTFFHTSPILADTDGDQLRDADEIAAHRNPLVSDLPRPEISVGDINLQLQVQFTESNAREKRNLESRSVSTTLTASSSRAFSRSDTATVEAHLEAGTRDGTESKIPYVRGGGSAGYTYQQSAESAQEAASAYENSLDTENEVTNGFTAERSVTGATMRVAVSLRNVSNLAYRVKNLQVTAFIQDPLDHARLTPVATLLPDAEPAEGYTLGPLVADRGPFIFSNSSIVPTLVESLMANSSGLVFRISNYDIINEDGRNFAFVSQDVVDRTAKMVLDYGGARSLRAKVGGDPIDENQPGDETEIFRVATNAGRAIADTNGDGRVDLPAREVFDARGVSLGIDADGDGVISAADAAYSPDTPVAFDGAGKEVGITLFQALAAAGLTRYDEAATPSDGLTDAQRLNSYSTYFDGSRERIFRIRGVQNDLINQKYWEILTPLGIDQESDLDDLILKTDAPVSLNFVQDLDKDGLPADVEYFLRTSDSAAPRVVQPDLIDPALGLFTLFAGDVGGYPTGTEVIASNSDEGLVVGKSYYLENRGGGIYAIYASLADATAGRADRRVKAAGNEDGVVKMNLASTGRGIALGQPRDLISFGNGKDPGFASGTLVRVGTSGGGLVAGTDYYIDNRGGGVYAIYSSLAAATTNGQGGRVGLTGPIDALVGPDGRDTDGDGLDDRFEALIGWTVTTPLRTYQVYSSPVRADSNFDAPKPGVDSDSNGVEDRYQYDGTDRFAAPAGWVDRNGNGLRDRFEVAQVDANDYVLDPIRKDTDGDGIDDATEIVGFFIKPITGDPSFRVRTNPNTPFTDGDTFSDGLERLVGLDPTNGNDTDVDGDGLPDLVEAKGWVVKYTGVSTLANQDGQRFDTAIRKSSTSSIDTDGDGLTDFEEYFLRTDPTSSDSDGDGIDDRSETLGYKLGHLVNGLDLGFIKSDPLDADTDNDKRSDGDEAELSFVAVQPTATNPTPPPTRPKTATEIERGAWVVRVRGQDPYRAFSNPLIADADFDGLVDGDEFDGVVDGSGVRSFALTDPNKGNTDGDNYDDGLERDRGTNPLAQDIRVTIVAQTLETSSSGTVTYDLSVRKPSPTGVGGLSSTPTKVAGGSFASASNKVGRVTVTNSGAYVLRVSYDVILPDGNRSGTAEEGDILVGQTVTLDPGARGVPLGSRFNLIFRAVAGKTVYDNGRQFTYDNGSGSVNFNTRGTTGDVSVDQTKFVPGPFTTSLSNSDSTPLGLASNERFSIESKVTFQTAAGEVTVNLGGINGEKAYQDTADGKATRVLPVFSYLQVADKFVQDFYFEVTVNGVFVRLRFFYLID